MSVKRVSWSLQSESQTKLLTLRTVIIRQRHVAIESDANRATLTRLELLAVELARVRMSKNQVMSDTRRVQRSRRRAIQAG